MPKRMNFYSNKFSRFLALTKPKRASSLFSTYRKRSINHNCFSGLLRASQ